MTNNTEILTPINIILAVGIILLIMDMCKQKNTELATFDPNSEETNTETTNSAPTEEEEDKQETVQTTGRPQDDQVPGPYSGDSDYGTIGTTEKMHMPNCPGGEAWNVSTSLLPKDDPNLDDSFTEFAPSLKGENYLDSTNFQIGMQSQTLRNANLQLRSDPPIEQSQVCAWMNTTIDPETRRDLVLGSQPVEVQ